MSNNELKIRIPLWIFIGSRPSGNADASWTKALHHPAFFLFLLQFQLLDAEQLRRVGTIPWLLSMVGFYRVSSIEQPVGTTCDMLVPCLT
jgi:hypothetical protein